MTNEEIKKLIHRRRHQILIHSFLYYRLDTNIISDHTYDMWSKELAELQQEYPELSKEVKTLYEGFKDFDGSSGYDLPMGDPYLQGKAQRLLEIHKKYKKEGKIS